MAKRKGPVPRKSSRSRPPGVPEEVTRAKRKAARRFLSKPPPHRKAIRRLVSPHPDHNVVGVGIGPKIVDGKETKTLCVRLYVRHKLPHARIGKRFILPQAIDGVPVDVIEVGSPRLLSNGDPQHMRPAQPGCVIAAAALTAISGDFPGTMGALVEDINGRLYILSNNHVLSVEETVPKGTAILQPGAPTKANRIGKLHTVVSFQPSFRTDVDCALAEVVSPNDVNGMPLPPVGPLSSAAVIPASVGMTVEKIGATTGHRIGKVTDIDADFQVEYDFLGTVLLENQIQIANIGEPFCDRGDSGALVVDRTTKQATGLLAVNMGGFALANHLSTVLSKLETALGLALKLKIS